MKVFESELTEFDILQQSPFEASKRRAEVQVIRSLVALLGRLL